MNHSTMDEVKLAFENYIYSTAVSSTLLLAFIAWSIIRELIPFLQKGVIFGWLYMILSSAAAVHWLVIYFLIGNYPDWMRWVGIVVVSIVVLAALIHSGTYVARFIVRLFKFGSLKIALGGKSMIMLGEKIVTVSQLWTALTIVQFGASVNGKVVSTVQTTGTDCCTVDGSATQLAVFGIQGTKCYSYTLAATVEAKDHRDTQYHIFVRGPMVHSYDRIRSSGSQLTSFKVE